MRERESVCVGVCVCGCGCVCVCRTFLLLLVSADHAVEYHVAIATVNAALIRDGGAVANLVEEGCHHRLWVLCPDRRFSACGESCTKFCF